MYKALIRPFLFKGDPEKVHYFSFRAIRTINKIPLVRSLFNGIYRFNDPRLERELFGLKFPSPVGLAAGFDKDAKLIDELGALGFGFVEIGTLTPKGQPGNPKPRLFRISGDKALLNRMGFNNDGVDIAVERLKKRKSKVLVGGNIGKNKITSNEKAFKDYKECFHALYPYVDYFVVNVSSPNTPGLRELQEKEPLTHLLAGLKNLNSEKSKPKPILLKIAPDLTNEQLDDIIDIVQETRIDGLIATNTTIDRSKITSSTDHISNYDQGGISGKPLTDRSTDIIAYIYKKSNGAFPIIGVGGIMTPEDALDKLKAGASLVQVYTGFVYEGPGLIKGIKKAILKDMTN